jgi:hypothetical protein
VSTLISAETMKAHRATWYVWAGGVKMRRQATMRGSWGYDVTCSCGEFETRTGGAVRRYVEEKLWFHRFEAQEAATPSPFPGDQEEPIALPAVPPAP